MKKIIIGLFILIILLLSQVEKTNNIIIPENAIRYRIIANSNSEEDQALKEKIKKEVEPVINPILNKSLTIETTRKEIQEVIPEIEEKINKYNVPYKINYGNNYFPEKYLYGISYPAGEYESLVITLGEGEGDNWWCVLFPPLCLIEAKEEDLDEITYSFYIKKIIEKFY